MLLNRITVVLLILLLIIIFIICYKVIHLNNNQNKNKNMNIKWNRNKCPYILGKTYENIFNKYNIQKNNDDWNLYLPCNYDHPKIELEKMPIVKDAKYFMIDNGDKMVAKNLLWQYVSQHYGIDKAKTMLPSSYILSKNEELARFNKEYDQNKLYIMKRNTQRQTGLKITNNKDEIMNGKNLKYVIVQELLQDPYTINGRKLDMRFYVLVICKDNQFSVYVHNEGFAYYTKVPYKKGSPDKDINITTGYIDREVYEKNPLTHGDMRKYLDEPNRYLSQVEKNIKSRGLNISQVFFQRIHTLIRDVLKAYTGHICTSDKFSNNICFQLFGFDVAVSDQLNPMILEINKGPDMSSKDERDSKIKHIVVRDIMRLVEFINEDDVPASNRNGFLKIVDA
jgi:Tubulin-tyrosine ligase family